MCVVGTADKHFQPRKRNLGKFCTRSSVQIQPSFLTQFFSLELQRNMNYKSTKRVQKVQDKGEYDENFGSDKMREVGKRLGEQINE